MSLSPIVSNSFGLNCCYYEGECWFPWFQAQNERLLLNDKTLGFLASGGDEFNPGSDEAGSLRDLCNSFIKV